MYSQILIIISSFIGVIGTVYAVLSILRMDIKDVLRTITYGGIETRDQEVLLQREQARIGIPLVVIGWIYQSAFSLIKVNTAYGFLISIVLIIISVAIDVRITVKRNKEFRKKYEVERHKPVQTHKDAHEWHDLEE